MLELKELDAAISIRDQLMDESKEPVVLVNVFHVAPEQTDALISAWTDDARYLKVQPGFISAQLHRGIAGSGTFLNYAVGRASAPSGRPLPTQSFRRSWETTPMAQRAPRICFVSWR